MIKEWQPSTTFINEFENEIFFSKISQKKDTSLANNPILSMFHLAL